MIQRISREIFANRGLATIAMTGRYSGVAWRMRYCGLAVCLWSAGNALACGWWGDGERGVVENAQLVDAEGRPTQREDPMASPARMVELGDAFRSGRGAPRDLNLALHWYRLAAERGHPGGQYNLALMYELGLGVVRDEARAADWYLQAARQGDVHAQHHLGRMLLDGRGADRDERQGLAWLEKAAKQGHVEVFLLLADAHAQGRGTAVDPAAAYAWCWLADRHGNSAAGPRCAQLADQLDPKRMQEARELARDLVGLHLDEDGSS